MTVCADVLVVGAGVVGTSIALDLTRAGLDVLVVDKAAGPGHGSTSASSAIVRFNYSTWAGVACSWESRQRWARWEDHLGYRDPDGLARFHRRGMVFLDAPIAPRHKVRPLFDAAGIPYEEWDAATLQARLPGIDIGAYYPPAPRHGRRLLRRRPRRAGSRVHPRRRLGGRPPSGGREPGGGGGAPRGALRLSADRPGRGPPGRRVATRAGPRGHPRGADPGQRGRTLVQCPQPPGRCRE